MSKCLIIQNGTSVEGNATPIDVLSGKTFMSENSDDLQTGTLSLSGDATPSDVLSGKTFYNTDATSKQTGTLVPTKIYDLGTGSSFNVSSYEGYENFTADNFLIQSLTSWTGWRSFNSGNNQRLYIDNNQMDKSYNSSTGVFTVSHYLHWHFGGGTSSGNDSVSSANAHVFLMIKGNENE